MAAWQPLTRWAVSRGFPPPRIMETGASFGCAFGPNSHQWLFQAGSTLASWNGIQIRLGFAPQWINQDFWLHGLDIAKHIEPLLGPSRIHLRTPPRVVIDPGHGGQNTGARSIHDGRWEKEYTLDWALRLHARLIAHGWEVILTRRHDVDVSLTDRVAMAEATSADLFVSLHFNAMDNGILASGLETYWTTPAGMTSTIHRGYDDNPATVHPNNAFDEANFQLAVRLHRSLLLHTGLADRGVRRARFMTVLQGQNRPAALVEGGYLTHPEDARRIADPTFRERLAEAVARALLCLPEDSSW
ncbi:MAG: N-acetylmuramoyl-L-alanine amidase [Verrucomicrobiota bacterium]|nr:N-acetylmuramoyl-L-alanine amidase [Limisphaera sp.]MDW8381996.1 N-acetylmuramoyl-L-alanine amidase [Verrucomicrobiota bacterium]